MEYVAHACCTNAGKFFTRKIRHIKYGLWLYKIILTP
jgi:hypothetical protein